MSHHTDNIINDLCKAIAELEREKDSDRRHIACLEQQVEQLREDEELLDLLLLWYFGSVDGPKRADSINRINELIAGRNGVPNGTA